MKYSEVCPMLTNWETKEGIVSRLETQQGTKVHSQTGEPRTGIISRLETQQGTTATHRLESQGQALSVG
jgi:hypothetical protein